MKQPRAHVIVLGCGVIGLTTATCLAEAGFSVGIVAHQPAQATVSAVAGALWGPYVSADGRVFDWSLESWAVFDSIANDRRAGVEMVIGVEAAREVVTPPAWLRQVPEFSVVQPSALPPGFVTGWSYRAPILDMPRYLTFLEARFLEAGGRIKLVSDPLRSFAAVENASGLTTGSRVVVNCTGMGAQKLVPDKAMSGAWGQLVVMSNPGLQGFFSDYPESVDPIYIIAHRDHVVVGGCVRTKNSDGPADRDLTRAICERAFLVEPSLAGARIIGVRTGLRPVRPKIRLEAEDMGGRQLIHNYGHGGSGVTLSWGCARHVVDLLN